jgi:hypothetical protein
MAAKILVRSDSKGRSPLTPAPETGWYLLGGVGWLFSVVSAADLALAWYPVSFGNPEWEFGTATTTLEHLPLLTLGLALIYGSAVARGAKATLKSTSILLLLVALFVVFSAVLLGKNIGIARTTVSDPDLLIGLNRSISQSLVQAVVYPLAFGWLGWKGWKHARSA